MLQVFSAKKIITLNSANPEATAVLVRDGHIVEAGSLTSLAPWLQGQEYELINDFADDVIVPGFIDPHLHPIMAAVLLPMEFITAMQWRFPWGTVEPTTTPDAFDTRLNELVAQANSKELLIVWGHHQLWHGTMSRARINNASTTQPTIVWDRSFHELCMNDAALTFLNINAQDVENRVQIDYVRGRFYEVGLGYALQKLNPYILAPQWLDRGLERLRQAVHFGGHTTIADMAVGIFDFDTEMSALPAALDNPETPFRVELIANGLALKRGHKGDELVHFIDHLPERNTARLRFAKRIKLFADGAFFSQLAQMLPPGYIDGHHGEWLMPPEILESEARQYWQRGYTIHVHVCGDMGVELTLDILERLQAEHPRFNHGFTLEHFGFSNPEQIRRAAALGANVSANVYYLHELSDVYARLAVGYERASSMARIGSCLRAGITTTLHSDFTMAPAQPLNNMWVAVNRINCVGNVMAPDERLTPHEALTAVTLYAAKVIGRDDEIGSIRSGKKADFTVLAENPLTVDPLHIKDIRIKATIFEGQVFPLP